MGTQSPENHPRTDNFKVAMIAAENILQKIGVKIEQLDRIVNETPDETNFVKEIKLKIRWDTHGDVLAIVRADSPAGPRVAFHSAETLAETLTGLTNRLANGTLKWREERPYASAQNE